MTIDGRPDLIPDPLFNENFMKSYNDQRRDRLGDVISDYLSDEDKTAKDFYDDLITELDDWIQYHQRFAEKYKSAKMMINGHRKNTMLDLNENIQFTNDQEYQTRQLNAEYTLDKNDWLNFPGETGDYITSFTGSIENE